MHATTATLAAHSSKRSSGLTRRVHRLVLSLTVSIALTAMMLTGVSVQADALVPSASTSECGGNSGSGWYVIVGEGGRAYSPEAEAFNPELAGLP